MLHKGLNVKRTTLARIIPSLHISFWKKQRRLKKISTAVF
jgi:hypothetical protein